MPALKTRRNNDTRSEGRAVSGDAPLLGLAADYEVADA
jgi:hypothetical protein